MFDELSTDDPLRATWGTTVCVVPAQAARRTLIVLRAYTLNIPRYHTVSNQACLIIHIEHMPLMNRSATACCPSTAGCCGARLNGLASTKANVRKHVAAVSRVCSQSMTWTTNRSHTVLA
jgi:hypothetical protein